MSFLIKSSKTSFSYTCNTNFFAGLHTILTSGLQQSHVYLKSFTHDQIIQWTIEVDQCKCITLQFLIRLNKSKVFLLSVSIHLGNQCKYRFLSFLPVILFGQDQIGIYERRHRLILIVGYIYILRSYKSTVNRQKFTTKFYEGLSWTYSCCVKAASKLGHIGVRTCLFLCL